MLYRMKYNNWSIHAGIAHSLIGLPDLRHKGKCSIRYGWNTKTKFHDGVYYRNWILSMDLRFGKYCRPGSNLGSAIAIRLNDGTLRTYMWAFRKIG